MRYESYLMNHKFMIKFDKLVASDKYNQIKSFISQTLSVYHMIQSFPNLFFLVVSYSVQKKDSSKC